MNFGESFPFNTALNTSTLMPFKLDIKQQISVAADAGYKGIEIWVRDVESYLKSGGTLRELRKHIDSTGIAVINGIAFFKWTDADETVREEGFVQAEREMTMLAELGCQGVAAPPYGNVAEVSLDTMACNFARLVDMGRKIGIEPYLEFWGRASKLSRLSETVYVAMHSGVPGAKILMDLFHMYTGGSKVEGVGLLNGKSIGVVHVNDYPAVPSRETITDKERVFPGDGIGPTVEFARYLAESGYNGYLSLELFIQDFGPKTAPEVAIEGLVKVKKAYMQRG